MTNLFDGTLHHLNFVSFANKLNVMETSGYFKNIEGQQHVEYSTSNKMWGILYFDWDNSRLDLDAIENGMERIRDGIEFRYDEAPKE